MESPILSQFLAPPLTTISQPLGELAAKATDVLLRQMQENATVEHVFLESRFIERESVVLAPIEQDTNTNATEV
jgi:DNA-binding LacI/PurR family transcriptional regulator